MKKLVLNRRGPEGAKALSALSYLLLIALVTAMAGGFFRAEQRVLLFPSVLFALLLLFGIALKKMLHIRRSSLSFRNAAASVFP